MSSTESALHEVEAGFAYDGEPRVLVTTQRKIATAFTIAAVISIVIGAISFSNVSRLSDDAAAVAHSQEVIGALQTVLSTATDAETAARGYTITASETFLQPYNQAVRDVDARLARLRALTADSASQQRRLEALTGVGRATHGHFRPTHRSASDPRI